MQKIHNPFRTRKGYKCFGCSPDHPSGLQMSFFVDGDEIVSIWEPQSQFEGYLGVLHGGIQATIMDEIASYVTYVKVKVAGVTSSMNVRYYKPIYMSGGSVTVRSKLLQMRRNLAEIEVEIYNHENDLCSEAIVTYFTFSEKRSKEEFYYPGAEAFLTDDQS
jgi:uncharacterized protein (TIGR00369 family)